MHPDPQLLIFSAQAGAYQRLIGDALPDLPVVATTSAAEARTLGATCPLVLGDPGLVRQILPDLVALQWVQSTWAGIDTLLDPKLRRDYILTNVRGIFGSAIAEYVIGYAVMHQRLGWQRFRAQQQGCWDATPPGMLRGKTMGILGVGSIGAFLAETAKRFGMHTLGYTSHSRDCPFVDRYFHGVEIYAFAAAADYLVCTLPNTPASRHLVDAGVFAVMPAHAVFVNVGRGSVVDEQALVEALEHGRIGGAILDVFEEEPLPPDHALWKLPNVIVTSHTAALSFPEDIAPLFVDNYRRWVAGATLRHAVDFARGY